MSFIRSILTLIAVSLCLAFPFAVGHGLSSHSTTAFLVGGGLLLAGAALIAGLTRKRATTRET